MTSEKRGNFLRKRVAPAAAVIGVTALGACTSDTDAVPQPTVTVTETVTAMPTSTQEVTAVETAPSTEDNIKIAEAAIAAAEAGRLKEANELLRQIQTGGSGTAQDLNKDGEEQLPFSEAYVAINVATAKKAIAAAEAGRLKEANELLSQIRTGGSGTAQDLNKDGEEQLPFSEAYASIKKAERER